VSSFIGCEQGMAIVEEHDKKFLNFFVLLKCHHVHPCENGFAK
jgi:hypothetical protein